MGFWLLVGVTVAGVIVFLLLLAGMYPGNGADLLDWDPAGRAARKILAEEEDAQQMRELRAQQEHDRSEREARRQNRLPE